MTLDFLCRNVDVHFKVDWREKEKKLKRIQSGSKSYQSKWVGLVFWSLYKIKPKPLPQFEVCVCVCLCAHWQVKQNGWASGTSRKLLLEIKLFKALAENFWSKGKKVQIRIELSPLKNQLALYVYLQDIFLKKMFPMHHASDVARLSCQCLDHIQRERESFLVWHYHKCTCVCVCVSWIDRVFHFAWRYDVTHILWQIRKCV